MDFSVRFILFVHFQSTLRVSFQILSFIRAPHLRFLVPLQLGGDSLNKTYLRMNRIASTLVFPYADMNSSRDRLILTARGNASIVDCAISVSILLIGAVYRTCITSFTERGPHVRPAPKEPLSSSF